MFERLTRKSMETGKYIAPYGPQKILDRLAVYEDSGLTPEEVQELAKAKAEGRLVEVVRCGECRYYNTTGCSDGCGWCENMDRGVFDEHYCSRGERREKDDTCKVTNQDCAGCNPVCEHRGGGEG